MKRTLLELTEEQVEQVMGRVKKHEIDSTEVAVRSIEHILHTLKHRIDATLPRFGSSRDGKRYTFIPASFSSVSDEFLELYNTGARVKSFLDVGCGIGNIMLIPYALGIITHGIEYDANVLEHSFFPTINSRAPKYQSGIYHMDALKFKRYSQYDVIYYYCPMCNSKMEECLEDKIQQEMSPGAYLFAYSGLPLKSSKFTKITQNIWQKKEEK